MHYLSDLFGKVLYMFRTGLLSIIRSISTLCTHAIGICHASSVGRLLAWSGWNVKRECKMLCDITNFLLVLTDIWRSLLPLPGQSV